LTRRLFVTFVPSQSIQFIKRYLDYKQNLPNYSPEELTPKQLRKYSELRNLSTSRFARTASPSCVFCPTTPETWSVAYTVKTLVQVAAAVVIKLWKIYTNQGSIDSVGWQKIFHKI